MNQEAHDAGYKAALDGKGAHDLPHEYAEDDDLVKSWYAGHGDGVRMMFLWGAVRMLKGRGYTREQIIQALEQ